MLIDNYLRYLNEAGFTSLPKGWNKKSVKKAGVSLAKTIGEETPKEKGFFEKCVKRMKKHMANPEGYCASMKDEAFGSTYWRGKKKTKKQTTKDVARHKNV